MPKQDTTQNARLKHKVFREARRLGAGIVGFAPVARWAEYNEVSPDYRPDAIWPLAQTVIVAGVPMLLPIMESTPSINYQELYNTANVLLDQIAYRLAVFLNDLGSASICLPRDGYGNLEILLAKMPAGFSHIYAAKYAGLGTIGYSHNVVTPQYGPRVRFVSLFTAARIEGDPVIERDLCKGCAYCGRLCPAQALSPHPGRLMAEFDAIACTRHHQVLVSQSRFPCGVCVKVCPIGADRKLYQRTHAVEYLREKEALERDPNDPKYRRLHHLRSHGSAGEGI
jgi:epoxyqueuosine reductase